MWTRPKWQTPLDLVKEGFGYSTSGSIWYVSQGLPMVEIGYKQQGTLFEEVHFTLSETAMSEMAYILETGTHDHPVWSAEVTLAEERLERLGQALTDGHGDPLDLEWLMEHCPLHFRKELQTLAEMFDATIAQRLADLSGRRQFNTHLGRKELMTEEEALEKLTSQGGTGSEPEEPERPTESQVWLEVVHTVNRELVGYSRDATAALRAANLARQVLARYELTAEEHVAFKTTQLIEQCSLDAMRVTANDRALIKPITDQDFRIRKRLYRFLTKRAFAVDTAPAVFKILASLAFSILLASMATSPVASWIFRTVCTWIIRSVVPYFPGTNWVAVFCTKLVSWTLSYTLPRGIAVEVSMAMTLLACWKMGWFGERRERTLDGE
jgi:hypothetical protein